MLAHLNSEGQLAAVLAHEIAHVAARHAVAQISRRRLVTAGKVVAAVAAPPRWAGTAAFGVAAIGLDVLLLRYSKGQEEEADELGAGYMGRAGYDPEEMVGVLRMM